MPGLWVFLPVLLPWLPPLALGRPFTCTCCCLGLLTLDLCLTLVGQPHGGQLGQHASNLHVTSSPSCGLDWILALSVPYHGLCLDCLALVYMD